MKEINIDWKERESQLQGRVRKYFNTLYAIQKADGEPTKEMIDDFVKAEKLLKASCNFRTNYRVRKKKCG